MAPQADSAPLVRPFVALAALLPGYPTNEDSTIDFDDFAKSDIQALTDFQDLGQRCLDQLSETAMALLRETAATMAHTIAESADVPTALPTIFLNDAPATASMLKGSGAASRREERQITRMFRHFDTNGTGLLSQEQFKNVLVNLGLQEQFSDSELDTLVGVVDKNGDSFIDLHEFTEWVCSSGGEQMAASQMAEQDIDAEANPRADVERNLRSQLSKIRASLDKAETELKHFRSESARASKEVEEEYEAEMEGSLQFWRDIASSSATPQLCQTLDFNEPRLLGNGKYGFVFRFKQTSDSRDVVVKLLGLRWARVAAKEYALAKFVGEHPNIIAYENVVLHADGDNRIATILKDAQDDGRIQSRTKREAFPDRFVCLTQEFMNRGTVQDWLDRKELPAGGMLVVMRCVADAVTHMHRKGAVHNDIKPENILLKQGDESDPKSSVMVKLADLGLSTRSADRSKDFSLYGLTVHSMVTGKKFGSSKFQPDVVDRFVKEVVISLAEQEEVLGRSKCDERKKSGILGSFAQLPGLLKKIWKSQISMEEVKDLIYLKGWNFFDGEVAGDSPATAA